MKFKVGITAPKSGGSRKRRPVYRSRGKAYSKSGYKYRKVKKFGLTPKGKMGFGFGALGTTKSNKLKKTASKALGIFLGIMVIGTLAGTVFLGATLANISRDLPDPDELINRESAQSTKIYDRGGPEDGVLLYTIYGDENREFVPIEKIPLHTRWAVLAAEDYEYYEHKGLDLPGIISAGYRNVVKGETVGASTISQQLVRNTLLYDFLGEEAYERTLTRKAKEALITMQMEKTLTKDEILQMYMNEIPLGGTNYGFQAGAKAYFGKDVSELTLAESAMLAGLIQAPGAYSPLFGSDPESATVRQHYVLDQMYDKRESIKKSSKKQGEEFEITEEMIEEAKEEELVYKQVKIDMKAPHFVFYVKQKLIEEYGIDRVERGGLVVTTTLDYDIQQIAEEEITAGVDRYRAAYNVHNGSMVAIDPRTGQIQAMVGSYDYWADPDPRVDGNVNVSTSERQMGSAVKSITYLTAFSQGYSPALLAPDIPFDFGYKTRNWDDSYKGLILARQGLVESRNISALYVMDLIGGPDAFIKTAETLGITTLTDRSQYGLSLTLGAGDMKLVELTEAYGVYANGGMKNPTTPILKVETYDGEFLQEWSPDDGKRVWDEKEIYLLNWTLCDLSGQGRLMGQYYSVGDQKLCGKTGTTNGPRDLTTFLYYPNLVVGVWTGNNNNEITTGNSGQGWSTTVPLPIANSFMSRVIGKYGNAWYSRPAGVVSGTVCKDTGLLAKSDSKCSKTTSVFVQGKLPPVDNSYVEKPICRETGKIATNEADAKALGLIDYKTFLQIKLPLSKHQGTLDSWLSKHSSYGSLAKLPDEAECPLHLGPGNSAVISFTSPSSGATFEPGDSVSLAVTIKSIGEISQVEYFFDGAPIGTATNSPYSMTYTIPGGTGGGSHTFSATVTETGGKTGSASVEVNVDAGSSVTVTLNSPTGGTLSYPQHFEAVISESASAVTFYLSKKDGTKTYTIDGSNTSGNTWGASWAGPAESGEYWVFAQALVGGVNYSSTWTSVTAP